MPSLYCEKKASRTACSCSKITTLAAHSVSSRSVLIEGTELPTGLTNGSSSFAYWPWRWWFLQYHSQNW